VKPTKTKSTTIIPIEMRRVIDALGDNWIFRTDSDGESHGGFAWGAVGVWTEAPDWNPKPVCGGGLHGQGPGGYGYAHKDGKRFVFCETSGKRVVVEGDKIKVKRARILFVGADAWNAMLYATKRNWPGSLDLRGCDLKGITLPTSVGGYLDLSGAKNVPQELPTANVVR